MRRNKDYTRIKDELISKLQRHWIVEMEVYKRRAPKRNFQLTATSVYGITKEYVIIKYYAAGTIPKRIKIRWEDIIGYKTRFKRKRIISNIDMLRIVQLKKSRERTRLFKRTMFYKWSLILAILIVAAGISTIVALLT